MAVAVAVAVTVKFSSASFLQRQIDIIHSMLFELLVEGVNKQTAYGSKDHINLGDVRSSDRWRRHRCRS